MSKRDFHIPLSYGADVDMLVRRLRYDNKKGRRAAARLHALGLYWWTRSNGMGPITLGVG